MLQQSSAIGSMLYTFDRAAWVASDALADKVPRDSLRGDGGWVVEIAPDRSLTVTFYRGPAASAQAFFVATVRDGKVVDSKVAAVPVPLTDFQKSMARAREVAAKAAVDRKYRPCTPAPFNPVVIPSQGNGPIAVYLLSAQVKVGAYPMGGHYRLLIGHDGSVLSARPYSVGCLNMEVPKLPRGAKPAGLMVNHLLDPTPTEIHVFTSYTARIPLYVATPDKRLWRVEGARIIPTPARH